MRILDFLVHGAARPRPGVLGLALAALLISVAPGTARAASIGLSATSGADVTITVSVSGIEALAEPSLGAFDLDLFFDATVLSYADIDFGPFLGGPADSLQSVNSGFGLVDFAEVSLVFPNSLLQDLQPDAFVLATITFDVLATEETLTSVGLSQTLLSDGNGQQISVVPVAPIELVAAIPEVSGAHVFGLGALVALVGHRLLARGRSTRATLRTGS